MNHSVSLYTSPKTHGEVYKNSKTKIFTDGTTNMIAHRYPLFKDKDIHTEYKEFENERKENSISEVHDILDRCNLNSRDFLNFAMLQHDEDFLVQLSVIGMTIHEFDLCWKYFNKREREPKNSISDEVRSDSLKRAKDQIFDYVLNNEFEYFFTGTIDPEKLDSKEPKELLKPVQKWLKNMVQRYDMQYIMIAERHKNGGIHFHGLLKANNLKLIDSGTKIYKGYNRPVSNERAEELGLVDGRTVYNLKTWSFGFTTCVPLVGDRMNTAFYVTKYITKDCKKIFGKFFWHSRDLKKPLIVIDDIDFDSLESVESNGFKYIFKRGIENETVREGLA